MSKGIAGGLEDLNRRGYASPSRCCHQNLLIVCHRRRQNFRLFSEDLNAENPLDADHDKRHAAVSKGAAGYDRQRRLDSSGDQTCNHQEPRDRVDFDEEVEQVNREAKGIGGLT